MGADLTRLRQEIAAVAAQLEAEERIAQPTAQAFWRTDAELRRLHAQRLDGAIISAALILSACDARMEAGHRHHPYKQRVLELERWLKELQRERDRILKVKVKGK